MKVESFEALPHAAKHPFGRQTHIFPYCKNELPFDISAPIDVKDFKNQFFSLVQK